MGGHSLRKTFKSIPSSVQSQVRATLKGKETYEKYSKKKKWGGKKGGIRLANSPSQSQKKRIRENW